MALPCPPSSISINQIRNELGTSSGSLRYLSSLAGFGTSDAMSEFRCYSPITYNYYTTLIQNDPCTSTYYDIYRRSDNNYFYYWNGSEYIAANGYWFSYAYYDYWDGLYYYDQYYIQNADMFSQGQTASYCSPS